MLYVADTNNHAIKIVDLKTMEVSNVNVVESVPVIDDLAETDSLRFEISSSGGSLELNIKLLLPGKKQLKSMQTTHEFGQIYLFSVNNDCSSRN